MNVESSIPGAQDKINEYVERIEGGESKDSIMQGLPKSFSDAIEERLANKEKGETEDKERIEEIREEINPTDKKDGFEKKEVEHDFGDHAQAVGIYNTMMDLGKGLTEGLKEDFVRKVQRYADEIKSGKSKEYVLGGLGENWRKAVEDKLAEKEDTKEENEFSDFRVKNGETDEGFFWNEYGNRKAKELKESGEFEWGKERIYFDVPIQDCEKLRDLAIEIASKNQIALAFKYIDNEKTFPVHKDGKETRFVVNFVSSEDARKFYKELLNSKEYQSLNPDRNVDYKGLRIDDLAEYSSGFREIRGALERAMSAHINENGSYEYKAESGKNIVISEEQFNLFKKQYDESQKQLAKEEELWSGLNRKQIE